jgi:UDP-2,4-diacetamido-2,4,6-trideoxy-beta-L-altropyranose hydrolase
MSNSSKLAVFRFYASDWRGAGHAVRCLTIAKALRAKGWECQFATEEESYDFVKSLQDFKRLDPNSFQMNPFPHSLLLIDHYDYAYEHEDALRPYADVIAVIDDWDTSKHQCDVLISDAYGRTKADYIGRVPEDCTIMAGSSYALLRPEFPQGRASALDRRKKISEIERIFVNFGGNDQKNMCGTVLKELIKIGYNKKVDMVLGLASPHQDNLNDISSQFSGEVEFHYNPNMAELMQLCDYAITAPAAVSRERFCLGLPGPVIPTADNQMFTYNAYMRDEIAKGDLSDLGLLTNFDKKKYWMEVEKVSSVTDGCGIEKIIKEVERRLPA